MCVSILELMISDVFKTDVFSVILPGLCAALFGIITGSIGICISQLNQIRQIKYLWVAFIFLVSQ